MTRTRWIGAVVAACAAVALASPATAEAQVDQHDEFFYVKLLGGYSWAEAAALNDDDVVPDIVDTNAHGGNFGAAAGFKLLFLDLGARGVYSFHNDYNLGAIMADVALRIPLPRFEPFIRVGAGYGWMNVDVNEVGDVLDDVPDGFMLDLGLGFDIWVTDFMTLGFDGAWGFYFLERDSVSDCIGGGEICDVLGNDGESTAGQVRLAGSVGFWF